MNGWEVSLKGQDQWQNCFWPLNPESPEQTWEEHLAESEMKGLEHRKKTPKVVDAQ